MMNKQNLKRMLDFFDSTRYLDMGGVSRDAERTRDRDQDRSRDVDRT